MLTYTLSPLQELLDLPDPWVAYTNQRHNNLRQQHRNASIRLGTAP